MWLKPWGGFRFLDESRLRFLRATTLNFRIFQGWFQEGRAFDLLRDCPVVRGTDGSPIDGAYYAGDAVFPIDALWSEKAAWADQSDVFEEVAWLGLEMKSVSLAEVVAEAAAWLPEAERLPFYSSIVSLSDRQREYSDVVILCLDWLRPDDYYGLVPTSVFDVQPLYVIETRDQMADQFLFESGTTALFLPFMVHVSKIPEALRRIAAVARGDSDAYVVPGLYGDGATLHGWQPKLRPEPALYNTGPRRQRSDAAIRQLQIDFQAQQHERLQFETNPIQPLFADFILLEHREHASQSDETAEPLPPVTQIIKRLVEHKLDQVSVSQDGRSFYIRAEYGMRSFAHPSRPYDFLFTQWRTRDKRNMALCIPRQWIPSDWYVSSREEGSGEEDEEYTGGEEWYTLEVDAESVQAWLVDLDDKDWVTQLYDNIISRWPDHPVPSLAADNEQQDLKVFVPSVKYDGIVQELAQDQQDPSDNDPNNNQAAPVEDAIDNPVTDTFRMPRNRHGFTLEQNTIIPLLSGLPMTRTLYYLVHVLNDLFALYGDMVILPLDTGHPCGQYVVVLHDWSAEDKKMWKTERILPTSLHDKPPFTPCLFLQTRDVSPGTMNPRHHTSLGQMGFRLARISQPYLLLADAFPPAHRVRKTLPQHPVFLIPSEHLVNHTSNEERLTDGGKSYIKHQKIARNDLLVQQLQSIAMEGTNLYRFSLPLGDVYAAIKQFFDIEDSPYTIGWYVSTNHSDVLR